MVNRRVQGGGNPAQGPPRDVLRSVPTDTDVESFPDVPPGNRAASGGKDSHDEHDVDLDAFAGRLGLRDDGAEGVDARAIGGVSGRARSAAGTVTRAITHTATGVAGRAQGATGGVLHGIARLMGSTSRGLDRIAGRLDRH